MWLWFLGWEDPLEQEMATHSSILAWKLPWKEEPDGLWSVQSQRVGHDWVTEHAHICNITQLFCTILSHWEVYDVLFYRRGTNTEKIRKFPSDSVVGGRARSWTQDQHWEPYSLHSLLQKMGRWLSWIGCSVAECSVIGQRKLLLKNYLNHLSPVLTYVRLDRAHPNSNADNY